MTVAPSHPRPPTEPRARPARAQPGLEPELSEPFPCCGEWFAGRRTRPLFGRAEVEANSPDPNHRKMYKGCDSPKRQ